MDGLAGYARLVELARRESRLIEAGQWTALVELEAERSAVLATLPPRPPREAGRLLEDARAIVRANVAAIAVAAERTRSTLSHVGLGRRAIASYGPRPEGDAGRFVDSRG